MYYYQDINIWSLDCEPLNVTEDNEHLGLFVSGQGGIIKFASWELAAFSKYFAPVSVNYRVSKPS